MALELPINLSHMLEIQKEHNKHYVDYGSITDSEKDQFTKDYVLLAIDELISLLRCTDYKKHRVQRVEKDRANVLEECIDVFKYILSICLVYDVSVEEFMDMFISKSQVVEDRYRQEQIELTNNARLICVDLDGVIADWSKGIFDWYWGGACEYYQDGYEHHNSYDIGCLFDIDKIKAEQVKLDFMSEGNFRELPVISGASLGMKEIRLMGYKIAIITARPYLEHRRVYADTIYWLQENEIPYDFIFWGKDKADIVFRELSPVRPLWFIEDRDKHAIELSNEGIPVILLDWPYNRHIGESIPNITRVGHWEDIIRIVYTEIYERVEW